MSNKFELDEAGILTVMDALQSHLRLKAIDVINDPYRQETLEDKNSYSKVSTLEDYVRLTAEARKLLHRLINLMDRTVKVSDWAKPVINEE